MSAATARRVDPRVAEQFRRWRAEPVQWAREVLGVEPDAWQADLMTAFARPDVKRLAASACKGPGKTAVEAWLGLHFLQTRPHCKVPCTSITGPNLSDGLWTEFAKWRNRSPLLQAAFTWTKTRLFATQHPETWWASARTWAQDADPSAQANTLAGLHEDYIFFILDEVSEIPDGVVVAAEAALNTGIECKMLICGNPTRTDGPLYRAVVTERRYWHVTRITGDPDDPKRSPRIDIDEARKLIEQRGRDDYYVKVNILGEFPDRQADKLLDIGDLEKSFARKVDKRVWDGAARIIGVDTAFQGDDDTVFAPRQGLMQFPFRELHGLDHKQIAEQLCRAIDKWEADASFVDVGGPTGQAVVTECRYLGYGQLVHGVNFGSLAADAERFENKRAELHWLAADWVKLEGGALVNSPKQTSEACAPIYWHDKKQRVCIEPKVDIKARIGRSPDRWDAFLCTFASPVKPRRYRELRPGGPRRSERCETAYPVGGHRARA